MFSTGNNLIVKIPIKKMETLQRNLDFEPRSLLSRVQQRLKNMRECCKSILRKKFQNSKF